MKPKVMIAEAIEAKQMGKILAAEKATLEPVLRQHLPGIPPDILINWLETGSITNIAPFLHQGYMEFFKKVVVEVSQETWDTICNPPATKSGKKK